MVYNIVSTALSLLMAGGVISVLLMGFAAFGIGFVAPIFMKVQETITSHKMQRVGIANATHLG